MRVTGRQIADAIDMLADLPAQFIAMDLVPAVLPGATFHQKQEALNRLRGGRRLFQRWRKLGLVTFARGRWALTKEAWGILQAQAIEARRAATVEQGAVHESAGPQDDAHKGSANPSSGERVKG